VADVTPVPLTGQQVEVLRLISLGLDQAEVAVQLGLTLNTVKTHVYRLYRRLRVRKLSEAVRVGFELELLVSRDVDPHGGPVFRSPGWDREDTGEL